MSRKFLLHVLAAGRGQIKSKRRNKIIFMLMLRSTSRSESRRIDETPHLLSAAVGSRIRTWRGFGLKRKYAIGSMISLGRDQRLIANITPMPTEAAERHSTEPNQTTDRYEISTTRETVSPESIPPR